MRTENDIRGRLAAGLIPLLFAASAGAQAPAETTAEDKQAEKPAALGDIEVTAQRRVEKLQDVPVAVTAFPQDQLESRGIDDLGDLNALAPGLQISKTPSNTTISQITIRGISQINPAIYWDPAVGVYVDGVYIGKAQGSIWNVVDLNRVEVLRGPQGTLYGRNTLAGAINLITRAPSGAFGGSASLELGNYNAIVQRASVDLPQWGIARINIAARSEQRDGWIDTTQDSATSEFNNRNNNGVRLAVDLDLAAGVIGEYRFDHSRVNQTNNFDQLYRVDIPFLQSYASRDRLETVSVDAPSFERSEIQGHSFTLTFDLDGGNQIKSISGYRRMDWNDSLDLDGSPQAVAWTQRFTDYEQFSQDLQFLGSTERWNYVAGIYYFGDDGQTNNPQNFFMLDPNNDIYFDSRYTTKTAAWAVYGQTDYRPIDPLTLTLGVRYTREKKELARVIGFRTDPADPFTYYLPPGFPASDETFDATTPTASVAWRFNENVNAYFRYAAGFKSGGFNGEFSDIAAGPQLNIDEATTPFDPERQNSFELGVKTSFAGGRAQFNAALFHNQLKDLQVSQFTGAGAAATVIRNAGEATVNGVELEFAFMPIDGTTVRANYAYLDPEYDEFIDFDGNAVTNVAGNRAFVHAPENTFNVVIDSELLRRDWGKLRAVADYAWTDEFYTYAYQIDQTNPNTQIADNSKVDAHGLLNLRLAIADVPLGDRGTGELAFWCRNALDDDTATNFIDFGPGFGNLTVANFEEPRTFGITGIVRW